MDKENESNTPVLDALFLEYAEAVLSDNNELLQLRTARHAFFAGALSTVIRIMSCETEEDFIKIVTSIREELGAYSTLLKIQYIANKEM